jgi:hypothetical protein
MKNMKNDDLVQEDTNLDNNLPFFAMHPDDEDDDKSEDEDEEAGDWGDVDPAGGDAPTSPGSAV